MTIWFVMYLMMCVFSFRVFSDKVSTNRANFVVKFAVVTVFSLLWPVTWVVIIAMVVINIRKEMERRGR